MTTRVVPEAALASGHKESAPSAVAPWPYFAEEEIQAAIDVLRSGKVNYWTGDEGRLFEREFAEFAGCKHAIALANGTVALEGALRAVGVGPGDEVITTARTFIASASCAVALGARPVIADVDRDSQNITANTIRAALTQKTKAIVVVHLAGWPCEMEDIIALAQEYGLKVVEDCAQAQGATYKGRPVGSMGHAAAFSFCQDKIMTTAGEGGMLTTNDQNVWRRAWSYKDHGKDYDAVYVRQHPVGFRWVHESFGTNWRMTEMQSAIGRVVLRKVPRWVEIRRRFAAILNENLAALPGLRLTRPPTEINHAYYKYYVFVRPEVLRPDWDRDRIMQAINAEGTACSVGSCSEIYLEAAFAGTWAREDRFPVARELGETSLMFVVHPTLSEANIRDTCAAIRRVMLKASKPKACPTATVAIGSSNST
jgi:dTDP-4-amino-4,6-dideoxygalactose transaminase